jgi:hypothetical protein
MNHEQPCDPLSDFQEPLISGCVSSKTTGGIWSWLFTDPRANRTDAISDALLQAGFEVVASSNGADALELIATRPGVFPIVVIILLNITGMLGH